MIKITIDGIETEVPEGSTILQAARQIGGRDRSSGHVLLFKSERKRWKMQGMFGESNRRFGTRPQAHA